MSGSLFTLLFPLRRLVIPTAMIAVFFAVLEWWQRIAIWVFGGSKSDWVVDNLVLIPSWWPALTAGLLIGLLLFAVRFWWLAHKFRPRILISNPKEYYLPWRDKNEGKRAIHYYYITVTNKSFGVVERLSVIDFKFENIEGHIAPESGRFFRARRERKADPSLHAFAREFELRGREDSIDFDICSMDERKDDSAIVMHYATEPSNRQKDNIQRSVFPHWLTIRVIAANIPEPQEKIFKISITDDNRLNMEAV